MLISQLMLLPVGIFCIWIFYLLSPAKVGNNRLRLFNLFVCLLAAALCVVAYLYVNSVQSGANDDIWRPVLAAVASYLIFPTVLLFGGIARMLLFQSEAGQSS